MRDISVGAKILNLKVIDKAFLVHFWKHGNDTLRFGWLLLLEKSKKKSTMSVIRRWDSDVRVCSDGAGVASQNQQGNGHRWMTIADNLIISKLGALLHYSEGLLSEQAPKLLMDLANIDSISEGIWVGACHSAAANTSLVLDVAEGNTNVLMFLGCAQAASEAALKTRLQRRGRNAREVASFLAAQGVTCLWGFPCHAPETFFRIPKTEFFFI